MLGLGSGLTSVSSPSGRVLLETYTADWSSDVDGWASYDGNDNPATLTHGVTFEGKSDALRVQFNTDPGETSAAGISLNSPFSTTLQHGDRVIITTHIYLDSAYDSTGDGSDDLTGLWDGTDIVTVTLQGSGQHSDMWAVAQDEWKLLNTDTNGSDDDIVIVPSNANIYVVFQSSGDRPQYKARFYLHGLTAKLYRSQLFT